MRIDGRINPETSGLTDSSRLAGQNKAAKTVASESEPTLEVSQSSLSYIQQAQAGAEMDPQAIARVKAMLNSGELDSPESIRETAKAMLERGL